MLFSSEARQLIREGKLRIGYLALSTEESESGQQTNEQYESKGGGGGGGGGQGGAAEVITFVLGFALGGILAGLLAEIGKDIHSMIRNFFFSERRSIRELAAQHCKSNVVCYAFILRQAKVQYVIAFDVHGLDELARCINNLSEEIAAEIDKAVESLPTGCDTIEIDIDCMQTEPHLSSKYRNSGAKDYWLNRMSYLDISKATKKKVGKKKAPRKRTRKKN